MSGRHGVVRGCCQREVDKGGGASCGNLTMSCRIADIGG
jgi:hypothetical protein